MMAQLDDLDGAKVDKLKHHGLVGVQTSPGNHQLWLAVTGAPQTKDERKDFALRLNRGVGADHRANREGAHCGFCELQATAWSEFPDRANRISQQRPYR
jgi:hypothetical protein